MAVPHARLRPHQPLDPGDPAHVERADGAVRVCEALKLAPAVGIVGPTGVGKSTELAATVDRLRREGRSAFHVMMDRQWNVRELGVDQLYIAMTSGIRGVPLHSTSTTFRAELLVALRGQGRRCVVVLDGLEKLTEARGATVLDALGELATEADIVTALPWFAAYGPMAGRILADQERVLSLRPVNPVANPGFFEGLLRRRLGDADVPSWCDVAARTSGGVPRTFLQLVADAGTYGGTLADLERATEDQRDSFRRALQRGDKEAIRAARGTDGSEIELDRRIRLLASGMLLEQVTGTFVQVFPHPILEPLLG